MSTRPDFVEEKEEVVKVEVDMNTPLADQARKLREVRDDKDRLEKELKLANKNLEELSRALAERMLIDKVDGYKVAGVGTVYINTSNKPYATDQPAMIAYFKECAPAMVKETVHPQTLLGWVNEQLENNKELPPCIGNFPLKRARIRKS